MLKKLFLLSIVSVSIATVANDGNSISAYYSRIANTVRGFVAKAPALPSAVLINVTPVVVTPTRLQTVKNAISTFAANSKTKASALVASARATTKQDVKNAASNLVTTSKTKAAALVTSVRATNLQDVKNAVISKRGAAVSAAVVVVGAAYWFRNEIKGFFGLDAKSDAKN